jgi:hypothetical protein
MTVLKTNQANQIFAFIRIKENNKILSVFNLSKKEVNFQFSDFTFEGKNVFSGDDLKVEKGKSISLKAWEYRILSEK